MPETKSKGRGRPARPDSVRAKARAAAAERQKKGIPIQRGRPAKAENIARKAAISKKREERAAIGKDVRGGYGKSDTSRRSVQVVKKAVRVARTPQKLEERAPTIRPSHKLKPSEVKAGYASMAKEPVTGGDRIEERGLHKRGNTTVTFARGGTHKLRRRTIEGKKTTVHVLQNMKHDPATDSYKPHSSYRSVEGKSHRVEEKITHNADPSKARRIKYSATKSKAGIVNEKMETGTGRRSVRKLMPSTGANEAATSHVAQTHRNAYHNAMESTRDRTLARQDIRPYDNSETKVPLRREKARIKKKK